MEPAPVFHADLAEGPEGGRAWAVTAADGVGLRVATWAAGGAKGTVLFFPGRTEAVEKYGRAARAMAARGYASAAIDWRGQGWADRAEGVDDLGHVEHFSDYQHDVAAYLEAVRAAGLPGPYFLIAHSMGGAIGLRALAGGLEVAAAAFSAPMLGIHMSRTMRPVARVISTATRRTPLSRRRVPNGERESYLLIAPFEENTLTRDAEMYAYAVAQARADARLALGPPTLTWLHEALAETRALAALPPPPCPTYVAIAGDEQIVENTAIRHRVAHWPQAQIEEFPGARHELMLELPEVREAFFDRAAALFDGAA